MELAIHCDSPIKLEVFKCDALVLVSPVKVPSTFSHDIKGLIDLLSPTLFGCQVTPGLLWLWQVGVFTFSKSLFLIRIYNHISVLHLLKIIEHFFIFLFSHVKILVVTWSLLTVLSIELR